LEEQGADCMKGRFDELPIHQSYFTLNNNTSQDDNDIIINNFHSLQDNDPALLQIDVMGMAPLHITCANPAVTKDMIEQLHRKNTTATSIRYVNDIIPWHMYDVVNKVTHCCMFQ
jgi:hypothetical protein